MVSGWHWGAEEVNFYATVLFSEDPLTFHIPHTLEVVGDTDIL